MEYAYIFNYNTAEIYGVKITKELEDLETEALLAKLDLSIDNCYIMFTDSKKEIEYLN